MYTRNTATKAAKSKGVSQEKRRSNKPLMNNPASTNLLSADQNGEGWDKSRKGKGKHRSRTSGGEERGIRGK